MIHDGVINDPTIAETKITDEKQKIPNTGSARARILVDCINTYGVDSQINMMIEEMAELTQALCKYRRDTSPVRWSAIHEEMADVYIVWLQMVMIFGYDEKIEAEKLERLEHRLSVRKSQKKKED